MKRFVRSSVYVLALSMASITATPLMASPVAQDRDHDRDNSQNRGDRHDDMQNHSDRQDDASYMNNKFYKQGWKDGQNHKRRNKKWKNDNDRMAYEAGFNHGDRGEQWHKQSHRDNDRKANDHRDHDQH